jgi:hypothetical protein
LVAFTFGGGEARKVAVTLGTSLARTNRINGVSLDGVPAAVPCVSCHIHNMFNVVIMKWDTLVGIMTGIFLLQVEEEGHHW